MNVRTVKALISPVIYKNLFKCLQRSVPSPPYHGKFDHFGGGGEEKTNSKKYIHVNTMKKIKMANL